MDARDGGYFLLDDQFTQLHVWPIDSARDPAARLAGPPEWSVDDPALATLQVSADGLHCRVAAAGRLGRVVVTVTGRRQGSDRALIGRFPITIGNDVGDGLAITADPPAPRADAPRPRPTAPATGTPVGAGSSPAG